MPRRVTPASDTDMRNLRIILASVMLIASLLWLILGTGIGSHAVFSERFQIIPSAIGACLGTTIFWIIATLLFGRVYCSTVCPVGTVQDLTLWAARRSGRKRAFRWHEGSKARFIICIIYLISLATGILAVGYVVEPWNMMRNAASAANSAATAMTWQEAGISVAVGIAAGAVAIAGVMVWAWHSGREFCTTVCPIGTMLGCVHTQTLFHIAIDPDKCVSCMKCEDICPAHCIDVKTRHVDNSRCVRCFDCTDVCPNDAIRYQINRDRNRRTPLMNPT